MSTITEQISFFGFSSEDLRSRLCRNNHGLIANYIEARIAARPRQEAEVACLFQREQGSEWSTQCSGRDHSRRFRTRRRDRKNRCTYKETAADSDRTRNPCANPGGNINEVVVLRGEQRAGRLAESGRAKPDIYRHIQHFAGDNATQLWLADDSTGNEDHGECLSRSRNDCLAQSDP